MTRKEKVTYWITSAAHDWKVAGHLSEKQDYPYALFLGHLTIEKTLKAVFVSKYDEVPPFTHRLTYLAEKAGLSLTSEQLELLEIITDFNLEAGTQTRGFLSIKNVHGNSPNSTCNKLRRYAHGCFNRCDNWHHTTIRSGTQEP